MRGAEKGGKTAPRAVGKAHLTGHTSRSGGRQHIPREIRRTIMSYKTRARKRSIRTHLKQQRAANRRLDRFLRPLRLRSVGNPGRHAPKFG